MVEFLACLSTVHVLQHAYFRFGDEQSQHLQNVKNAEYVPLNFIFACQGTLSFINIPMTTFGTVLVIIKLTKCAVALRLRCGSCKLIFDIIS